MRLFISLTKLCLFIGLAFFSCAANAEYYLGYPGIVPNVVSVNCNGHHCRWRTRHYSRYHAPIRHHRSCNLEKYCDQDMATGDDNACLHPDMQIN